MAPAIASLVSTPRFHTVGTFLREFANGFPDHGLLNDLANRHGLHNDQGLALRFVPPSKGDYEQRVYTEAKVPTREANWHDLFNALAWFSFPRTKALLNRLHVELLSAQQGSERSKARDVLTLFDESGMVIACTDPELAELIQAFRWQELFWHRREEMREKMVFYIFGHALHEQLLEPYKGITAKAVIVTVEKGFMRETSEKQRTFLDDALSTHFSASSSLDSAHSLQPVPVLGIPGWWHENEEVAYYTDTTYFRPGRGAHKK